MPQTASIPDDTPRSSLGTRAARTIATTTKTPAQKAVITPRWLLRLLPWVEVEAGAYRVNRCVSHSIGDGRITVLDNAGEPRLLAGNIAPAAFARALTPRTRIAAFAHVSNVLGTVLPVREPAALAHAYGAAVIVDGAQAVAHLPVDVRALDVDFYVFSGHKIFAPTGIGALYGRLALLEAMPPGQGGGGMIESVTFEHTEFAPAPQRFEAGTMHIAGAVGLGAALDYLASIDLPSALAYEEQLHAYARTLLSATPGLRLLGAPDRQISVLTFTVDGIDPARIAARLDAEGIMARAGHHCAQPTLRHYGLTSAVRPSLAIYNTQEEIDRLVRVLRTL